MALGPGRALVLILSVLVMASMVALDAGPTGEVNARHHTWETWETSVISGPAGGNLNTETYLDMNAESPGYDIRASFSFLLENAMESAPCAGASVDLRIWNGGSFSGVRQSHTDELGVVRFEGLEAGIYHLRIETDDDRWVRVGDGSKIFDPTYYWDTEQFVLDGDMQLEYSISDQNRAAWAMYSALRDGGDWLYGETGWQRSKVTVVWPEGEWPHSHGDVIHMPSDSDAPGMAWDSWIALHEYGHCVHYELRGGSFPVGNGPDPHYIDSESSLGFALTEGWAQFFERAVHGDPERTDGASLESTVFADGPFGNGDEGDMDGAIVEGAVANLLWDIYDGVDGDDVAPGNDDGDMVDRQFAVLWNIIYRSMPNGIDDIKRAWPERSVEVAAIFHNARIPMELDPPSNPDSFESSHETGADSLDSTITIRLSGAGDDGSGVLGYSILIDDDEGSMPDTVIDTYDAVVEIGPLDPGTYFIHVRTVDRDGNWAGDAYTIGPFIISEGASPIDDPLFPEGDELKALFGLAVVMVAIGLILVLVLLMDRGRGRTAESWQPAGVRGNCPNCGRLDHGGYFCPYCGSRLR